MALPLNFVSWFCNVTPVLGLSRAERQRQLACSNLELKRRSRAIVLPHETDRTKYFLYCQHITNMTSLAQYLQTLISSQIGTRYFWEKSYQHYHLNLLLLLVYNSSAFDNLREGGSVSLTELC